MFFASSDSPMTRSFLTLDSGLRDALLERHAAMYLGDLSCIWYQAAMLEVQLITALVRGLLMLSSTIDLARCLRPLRRQRESMLHPFDYSSVLLYLLDDPVTRSISANRLRASVLDEMAAVV
jgi:hypothetical protein